MADYSGAYEPSRETLQRLALEKLKRNARGYELERHDRLYCIRCGVLVGSTAIHDSVCPPNQVQLDAQLELLNMEGGNGNKVF
jgi:hypothetical protein